MVKMLGSRVAVLDARKAKPLPKTADSDYGSTAHKTWAFEVKSRAGWRCEHVENGHRCERSRARGDRMYADHILEVKDRPELRFDLSNGACKCAAHNVKKGIEARAARMDRSSGGGAT
ncbi:HNH endonuclease [Rhodopseudomonas sp. BR0C11]|uniref:HNH endonuclease n=1 Tax=Rhodopseudomonas sp. BR0C11 TaxID=2269370 RepID=UPI0013DF81DD|nr:HNH endonuclease [Rhodopseudomonas sp. BR0C11]NEV75499.1 HNH endonuclease [Rhodopseudomonas sp. BR0C11]